MRDVRRLQTCSHTEMLGQQKEDTGERTFSDNKCCTYQSMCVRLFSTRDMRYCTHLCSTSRNREGRTEGGRRTLVSQRVICASDAVQLVGASW